MKQSENTTLMQLVVGTEAMFFLCLIMVFIYMAYTSGFEPHDLRRLDIRTTGGYTVLLIGSSLTLHLAERGSARGKRGALRGWLIVTLLLGALFLFGQGREYMRLIGDNVTLGGSIFGASFFTLTGFHAFHVLAGLVVLAILLTLAFLGDPPTALGAAAIYWHFVDVVWIVVFTVVYVLPLFSTI